MSTRSYVLIQISEEQYTGIYVHNDGSEETRLPILNTHYNTKQKVLDLINLGCLSVIGDSAETCVCYHRDLKESWENCKPKTYKEWVMRRLAEKVYIFNLSEEWEVISRY